MSYQLELRHIRYFLAVAEDLHFRKAAEKLYISQPGLSRQIKEMEEGLGILLFERHNRKVELTKAGLFLKEKFSNYSKELEHIIGHGKMIHDGLLGDIQLGYVGSAMQKVIPDLLMSFRNKYPKVRFSLSEMGNQDQIDGLFSHDIDIGFVRLQRIPRGLESCQVLEENFCLVLPAYHKIDEKTFHSLAQFKEESFILFDPKYSASYYEKVMQIFDESGFSPLVTHSTIHAGSIFKLVENNFGISIVPKSLQISNQKGIKFIELKNIPQSTVLSAVWKSNSDNPILSKFLSLLSS